MSRGAHLTLMGQQLDLVNDGGLLKLQDNILGVRTVPEPRCPPQSGSSVQYQTQTKPTPHTGWTLARTTALWDMDCDLMLSSTRATAGRKRPALVQAIRAPGSMPAFGVGASMHDPTRGILRILKQKAGSALQAPTVCSIAVRF